HLTFSTKNREPWITPEIRPALHAYLAGAVRALNAQAYRVGGVADHVHLACTLPRTISVSKLEEIKKSSSTWIKQQNPAYYGFAWQAGYGVFSLLVNRNSAR
ncbi:MAG TPA: transposase, partial [Lentisphaeria bacterium]|nr:transposase [Lentisphaeria bacterium]